ncbi:MAG TPA: AmmeMemoRadiSam system protein A [Acidobacteriota bacterium]|nr:AmmeMemoRadiSam system protein A [Acidobacteriota bacterium]
MLDESDKSELLRLARSTLETYFSGGRPADYHASRPSLLVPRGAFVSLHCGEELRGCIGQMFGDRELYRVVQHCVLSAALEDSRFDPVTPEELPCLKIEISALTPLEQIHSVEEIEVGRHGIYITRGFHRGLLLPQVATQYRWDRETFLAQTCRKAGLPETAWRDPKTSIQIFTAEVFSE